MKKHKILTTLLIAALTLTALTACSDNADSTDTTETVGTTASDVPANIAAEWDRSDVEHWQVCENGEIINKGNHNLDESGICTECGSEVYDYGDGMVSVYNHDEEGNAIRMTSYENGNMYYEDFCEYSTDANGDSYESKCTEYWYDSGSMYISESNEYGDQTNVIECDLDGNILFETRFEREYNENGDTMWEKTYQNDMLVKEITGYKLYENDEYSMRYPEKIIDYYEDGTKLVAVYGDNGKVAAETYYNADETVDSEYTYAYETFDDGNWKCITVYKDGALYTVTDYEMDEEFGWSYITKLTEYDENGNVQSVTEYDGEAGL